MVATEAVHPDSEDDAWVQVWVQLKKKKWLPISRKRHQIGHLDFRSFRLLTEMLEVRILPGEPNSLASINYRVWVEHSAFDRMLGVCEVKSGLQVGEAKAFFCDQSDVNNCCHKNVIVASH